MKTKTSIEEIDSTYLLARRIDELYAAYGERMLCYAPIKRGSPTWDYLLAYTVREDSEI